MDNVFDAYLIVIIVALLIGIAIGVWVFRRSKRHDIRLGSNEPQAPHRPRPAPPPIPQETQPPAQRIDSEGDGIADEAAAATADVAGQVLGVQAHSELPGASGPPDNLEVLKGVGPKLAQRLNENGILRFEQLARLSDNEVALLDERLGPFKGRLSRDRVVEQASYLARGDTGGFEARFGKIGGGSA